MSQPAEKFVTPVSLIVDAVLVSAFFVFMFFVLRSHVPSEDPRMVALWSALGSSCLSGVFWLAVQMFRVVLRFQRASRR
ncbi:hypothetical protein [Opitutus terrae]|uniref:Uncharacterized protein n=1 Tax=Opitutus terrae (strain DSM 11246 / JCM 15787 / PB90-1) TaxID=452637 RepID=B2A026_OPITP|nr:hypothetical protein [Opitutus terrae]ACB77362.1 hypothetical protein Oter_4088 [Opitutus terrae PB90-1]